MWDWDVTPTWHLPVREGRHARHFRSKGFFTHILFPVCYAEKLHLIWSYRWEIWGSGRFWIMLQVTWRLMKESRQAQPRRLPKRGTWPGNCQQCDGLKRVLKAEPPEVMQCADGPEEETAAERPGCQLCSEAGCSEKALSLLPRPS